MTNTTEFNLGTSGTVSDLRQQLTDFITNIEIQDTDLVFCQRKLETSHGQSMWPLFDSSSSSTKNISTNMRNTSQIKTIVSRKGWNQAYSSFPQHRQEDLNLPPKMSSNKYGLLVNKAALLMLLWACQHEPAYTKVTNCTLLLGTIFFHYGTYNHITTRL